jgi:hypothetical protein
MLSAVKRGRDVVRGVDILKKKKRDNSTDLQV